MNRDPREWLPRFSSLSKRQLRVLFIVGFVLGAAIIPNASALLALFNSSYSASGGVTYAAPTGPNVNVTESMDVQSGNPFPDANTVALNTSQGNITLSSTADTNVTVDNINGTWTNTSQLDVSPANLTINPDDKQKIVVGGNADRLDFRSGMDVDDGTVDLVYGGASGTTTLKLYGLPANTVVQLRDTGTNDVLGGGTTTSNGVLTVTEVPNSDHTVKLETSSGDPEFDSTTASPTGDQSTAPEELSINVSDPDMPGDNVTVEFYHKNETANSYTLVGTDSRDTAGVVNTSIDGANLSSGEHKWYAVAEDEAGQTTQSTTFEFGVADELRFYNESKPSQLLNNTTITATIYADDQVFNRTTTNGTIPLSGLPAGTELVITAEADGYYSRHIVIEELSKQQSIYLLDKNVSAVEVRFKIEDKTGEFPPETTEVIVKRPISVNGTTKYQVIAADEAGVNGFTTFLEEDVRYRLVVRNDEGDERVLGAYTASVSETVTLTIGQLGFGANPRDEAYSWDTTWQNESGSESIRFNFSDPTNQTENLHVKIYERGNESNVLFEQTHDGPFGTLGIVEPIPENQTGKTWIVTWDASRNGSTIQGQRVVGSGAGSPGIPLDSMWKNLASVGLLIVMGGLFGGVRADLGAVIVSLLGGVLWWIEWLPGAVGAGAVVLAIAVSAFYYAANRRPA